MLDRFVGVHLDYYDDETEREIVREHVDLADEDIATVVDATRQLRDDLEVVVGTRAAITAAKGLTVFNGERNGDDEEADEGQFDEDLLTEVFTDVLAPKVVGEGIETIDELQTQIRKAV